MNHAPCTSPQQLRNRHPKGNTRASRPIVFVQEHDQNTTAAESVDGGGVPAQNSTNDSLMFVLPTDLVKSLEDDVQPESQHEPARVSGGTQVHSVWYVVVHDLVPTNVKLHSIHIITTDACLKFGATYTLMHRLTERGATVDIWTWTTTRLPMIHRTTPRRISQE
jgi:hypothetical protein